MLYGSSIDVVYIDFGHALENDFIFHDFHYYYTFGLSFFFAKHVFYITIVSLL